MHLVRSLPHVYIVLLVHHVHKCHREYTWQLPLVVNSMTGIMGKSQSYTCCIVVAVCHRHQLTSNFNRASLPTTSTVWTQWRSASISTSCGPIHCIWVPGEITCSPVLGSINFCWYFCTTIHSCCSYTCSHILHILWGFRVVASLKPLTDSGYTSWVPFYIMPKEPTRSNMAPRSLFGIRIFVQWSKIQLVSQK